MNKKLVLVCVGFLFAFSYNLALAQVIINEFVSDPDSGPEWIEFLNTSSSEINLSSWNWTELASPGTDTEHEGSPKNLTGIIPYGGVFVFEMTSALNNAGDSIGLYNGAEEIDRVSFGKIINYTKDLDLPTKGKSGAVISGTWKTNQDSTKGEINPNSSYLGDEEDETPNSNSSSSESSSETKIKVATQKIKVQITNKQIAYVGIPFLLEGSGTDEFGDKLSHGRYFWNFGDGDFREVKVMNTDKFTHTYFYSGDYNVTLEYFPDSFADTPVAVGKTTIKVITPEVLISSVGDEKDFFIELSNKTSNEVDISNWVLLSDYRVFKIPRNTIIQANKKMIISPKITNFSIVDKNTLRLVTAEGNMVTSFSPFPAKQTSPGVQHLETKKKEAVFSDFNEIDENINNLPALANEEVASSTIFYLIFFIFITFCAGAVYFIRQKKTAPVDLEEFEILDE